MFYENPKTLSRIYSSGLTIPSRVILPASQLAKVLLGVEKNEENRPDWAAVKFYSLNQMVSLLRQKFTLSEQLPEYGQTVVREYELELIRQHRLMVWYMFLIITREFRHTKSILSVIDKLGMDPSMKLLMPKVLDDNSNSTLNSWLPLVPDVDLSQYCQWLVKGFDSAVYAKGYGGPPWGRIAETLYRYVSGQTSAEIMIDTAYTLAHNNGPMFNKQMFFAGYSSYFIRLLDIQRSGQMCEGLVSGALQKWVTPDDHQDMKTLVALASTIKSELGGIGEYIDWFKVEKAGAISDCTGMKDAQVKHHGAPDQPPKKPAVIDGYETKITGEFQVYPGQVVKTYKRLKAVA